MTDQKLSEAIQNPSQEFSERFQILDKEKELAQFKHDLIMEELKYKRENDKLHHEKELERGRIKNAEDRKLILFKSQEIRRAKE